MPPSKFLHAFHFGIQILLPRSAGGGHITHLFLFICLELQKQILTEIKLSIPVIFVHLLDHLRNWLWSTHPWTSAPEFPCQGVCFPLPRPLLFLYQPSFKINQPAGKIRVSERAVDQIQRHVLTNCLIKTKWEPLRPRNAANGSHLPRWLRGAVEWGAKGQGDLLFSSKWSCRKWGTPQQFVIYALSLYLLVEYAFIYLVFVSLLLTSPSILCNYQFVQ